jgi:hypothetical protein
MYCQQKKQLLLTLKIIILCFLFSKPINPFFPISYVYASSRTITSRVDWKTGEFNNTEADTKEGDLKVAPTGTWSPRSFAAPPIPLTVGTALGSDGTYLYALTGRNTLFARYSYIENDWEELAPSPYSPDSGADMTYLNGYLYVIFGGYSKRFYRYSVATNTWEKLTDTFDYMQNGAGITTDGTLIYVLRGTASADFWIYNPLTGNWQGGTSAPASISTGADIVYYDNALFALRGSGTNTLYRYDINAHTWSTKANAPVTFNDVRNVTVKGTYMYVDTGSGSVYTFYRYDLAANTWSTALAVTPFQTRYVGSIYNAADNQIYLFRGNGTYDMWKYDDVGNSFLGPADISISGTSYAPGTGSDILRVGSDLYYARGGNTTTFLKYTVSTNAWSSLAAAPASFNDDCKGIVAGSLIYFMRCGGTQTFYSYNTGTNTWSTLTNITAAANYGGVLAYPGSGDFLYATRGGVTRDFYRYSISANSWSTMTSLPDDAEASFGARLIGYDSTSIYYLSGAQTSRLLRYNITDNSWTVVSNLPYAPFYGTDAVLYNGKIYVIAGYYKDDIWEYDISGNSWRQINSSPNLYNYDIAAYNGASIESMDNGTFYVTYGGGVANMNIFTVSGSTYQSAGTWTSSVQDLSYVASWNSLATTTSIPGNSSITFQTRSSADLSSWSDWVPVSGTNISSPARRYIQIKATLTSTSDLIQTPILHQLIVNYTGDENAPNNPVSVTAKSQEVGGTSLISEQPYSYTHPAFSWLPSSDSETSVLGYYVYFGTNSSGDPSSDGSFQTATNYVVSNALENNTYYLRISTKDSAGNVSNPVTLFTYKYNGVPATTLTYNTSSVFSQGDTTNLTTSGDQIKLSSKSGFWSQERLTQTPAALAYGSSMAYVSTSNKAYVLRGANTNTFYEYDVLTDSWAIKAVTPSNILYGGQVIEGPSGFLYATPANNTSTFWRYNIEENTWSDGDASDAPQSFYYGTSFVFDGEKYIYVLRGNNDDGFMRYDTLSDTWELLPNTDFGAPTTAYTNNVYVGGDLAFDGEDTIYAEQGNSYNGFAKYTISTNTWTPLDILPFNPSYGSQLEFDSNSGALYYLAGWSTPYLYKYETDTRVWTKMSDAPGNFYQDSVMRNVADNMFILRSNSTQNFYKYNIEKNSWLTPTRGLFGNYWQYTSYMNSGYGADIIKGDSTNLYILQGNYNNTFVKYDTSTGTITRLADTPIGVNNGGAMGYDSTRGTIYFIASALSKRLFTYNIATDYWSEVTTDTPPVDSSAGSSFAYDGNQYMYWNPGGGSTAFYRYNIVGNAGSRWEVRQNLPAGVSYGAQLVYKDGYLYTLRGNNINPNPLYRYDPSNNTWGTLASIADAIYNDGFLVDGGSNTLFACKGVNTRSCYSYNINSNTWSAIANAPAQIYQGGSAAWDGEGRLYVLTGNGTDSYADGLYTYVIQSATTSFENSGSYISGYHDLTSVYKYGNIAVNYVTPPNTSLSVYTCTSGSSSDSCETWSEATLDSSVDSSRTYSINSDVNRYIRVKLLLTSGDSVYSPVVSSYSVSYYQDITRPNNPDISNIITYSDQNRTNVLITNNWYSHVAPYFDWPDAESSGGASDGVGGSGIVGYYVYFDQNAAGDPVTDGQLITESSFTPSTLVSGKTYYFKLKTVDDAGNVSVSSLEPFIYKFDNVAPEDPTGLAANPSGYTAVDSFNFSWNSSNDADSEVVAYCYKTGASSGVYSIEQCVTQLSVLAVTSYKSANNTFYVRSKDSAGNYSAYVPVTYYFSSSAPGAPQNLTVTASSPLNGDLTKSQTNSFAFAWNKPETYFGNEANLVYYYSVNALPTAQNTSSTSLRSLLAGPYATLPGDNVFYVVAKDESGRVDWANHSAVTFTADTAAPGIPNNMDIADVSVKSTSSWKLATSWEAPTSGGSGVSSYDIFRSVDGTSFSKVASTSGISFVDTNLLQETYYYKVRACDNTNNCGGFSTVVSLLPDGKFTEAATLIGDPTVSAVTTKKAQISWSTARTSDSKLAFGTSSGKYQEEEVASSTQVMDHMLTLTNLSPGTKYYFVAKWTDEDGNLGLSSEYSFQTLPAPSAKEVSAVNVGLSSADISFTSKDGAKAKVYFGETSAFGGVKEVGIGTVESKYFIRLEELKDGTKYYFKLNLLDAEGAEYEGDIYSFETLPRPQINDVKIIQVKGTAVPTVYVTWSTNTEVSSIVTYYPVGNPGASQDSVNISLDTGKHRMLIEGLLPNTPYVFIASGRDRAGNEAHADSLTVTTSSDTRPPLVNNLKVEGSIQANTNADTQQAQLVVSWNTDEAATSQVDFGEGSGTTYSNKSQEDSSMRFNHLVVISGLTPSKVYHLRVISKDSAGNETKSIDTVTITPKATDNALDLVVTNLSDAFGFLGKIN